MADKKVAGSNPSANKKKKEESRKTTGKQDQEVEHKLFQSTRRGIARLAIYAKSQEATTASRDGILLRSDRLIQLWQKANEQFQTLVETAEEESLTDLEELMEMAEKEYYDTAEILRQHLRNTAKDGQEAAGAATGGGNGNAPQVNVSLTLPMQQHDLRPTWGKFGGALSDWMSFRDRFKAAIHDNPEVSTAYKYSYLRNSLTGDAEKALGQSNLAEGSYQEAWERLNQLYHKPYHIAKEQLGKFNRLPFLSGRPTAKELQKMSNETYEVIRQLKALEVPVEHWGLVFVFGLHERLDPDTKRQWELQRSSEAPEVTEMLNFLDKQAGSLEDTRMVRAAGAPVAGLSGRPGNTRRTGAPNSTTPVVRAPCEACGVEAHGLYHCPEFMALNLSARKNFVQRRKLCPNCLKKGHSKEQCTVIQCRRLPCQGDPRHNSVLCPFKQPEQDIFTLREPARKSMNPQIKTRNQ
ncbi:uncharacterized protein LOC129952482 [Eupeodes corollae]|uniref:uncharacterized protein LOC129952482 n=1 Tax=Eupeodes corollae TaxID=290404 RepID=UPI002491560C|nr:uncharacterized protein LOC129952482 [Eupeodes corollae]